MPPRYKVYTINPQGDRRSFITDLTVGEIKNLLAKDSWQGHILASIVDPYTNKIVYDGLAVYRAIETIRGES